MAGAGVEYLFFASGSVLAFYQEAIAKALAMRSPNAKAPSAHHEYVAINAEMPARSTTAWGDAAETYCSDPGLGQGLQHAGRVQRNVADSTPCERRKRVCDRGRRDDGSRLRDTGGRCAADDEVHLDIRSLRHAQNGVVEKARLFGTAVLEGHPLFDRRAGPEDQTALDG